MRRLVAFVGDRIAGLDLRRRARPLARDRRAQLLAIALGDEACSRHMHEVGIAEPGCAIRIGELHRFRHDMQRRRRIVPHLVQRIGLQHVEDLHDMDNARGGWRHGDDLAAAIDAMHDGTLDGAIACKIGEAHLAAGIMHGGGNALGDGPRIEAARSRLRNLREAPGEIALHEALAALQWGAIRMQEDGPA